MFKHKICKLWLAVGREWKFNWYYLCITDWFLDDSPSGLSHQKQKELPKTFMMISNFSALRINNLTMWTTLCVLDWFIDVSACGFSHQMTVMTDKDGDAEIQLNTVITGWRWGGYEMTGWPDLHPSSASPRPSWDTSVRVASSTASVSTMPSSCRCSRAAKASLLS